MTSAGRQSGASADVLVVCTANICRSPAAAELLALAAGAGVSVGSAGVHANPARPACPITSSWLEECGVVATEHLSLRLTVDLVRAADLVLTMTREQRGDALRLLPSRQPSTFTLAQAARLGRWVLEGESSAEGTPGSAERVLWMSRELDAARASVPLLTDPEGDDIADPHKTLDHPAALEAIRRDIGVLTSLLRA